MAHSLTKDNGQPQVETDSSQAATHGPQVDAGQHSAQQNYLRSLSGEEQATQGEGGGGEEGGLAHYEATLGKFLGKQIYRAVSKQVTPERMHRHAEKALDKVVEYIKGSVGDLDAEGVLDETQLNILGDVLYQSAQPELEAFMMSGAGREMVDALAEWVDTSPRSVALIALLAAAGAIVANMKVPAIKKRFKIREGLSARVSAKLGRLQEISLQEIKTQLDAHGSIGGLNYSANVTASYSEEDGEAFSSKLDLTHPDNLYGGGLNYTRDHTGEAYGAHAFGRSADERWYGEGRIQHHSERGTEAMGLLRYQPSERFQSELQYRNNQREGNTVEGLMRYQNRKGNFGAEFGAGHSEHLGNTIRAGLRWTF